MVHALSLEQTTDTATLVERAKLALRFSQSRVLRVTRITLYHLLKQGDFGLRGPTFRTLRTFRRHSMYQLAYHLARGIPGTSRRHNSPARRVGRLASVASQGVVI